MNSQYNFENILTSLNQIENHRIVPTNVSQKIHRQQSKFNQFDSNDIPNFPLEWFDNVADADYDSRYFPQCREGFAFLPVMESSNDFEWHKVNIKAHNNESNKWHIEDVSNGVNYEVPRIYLMFIVEDPHKFSERIQNAIKYREICEYNLRFEAILNEFPMNRIPYPFVHLHDKIEKLLNMNKTKTELMEFYQRESCIVFQKFLVALQLIKFINGRKSNSEYLKQQKKIELPRKLHVERNFLTIECQNNNNDCLSNISSKKKSERNFKQLWLYCCPQSIKIMEFINNECESVSRMSFFHIQASQTSDWEDFLAENKSKLQTMSNFLQSKWIDKIVYEIQSQLANVGKGWYDMKCMNNWSIYKMSKLYRLIELIKKRMEVSIMKLLKSSLRAFVNHLCRPCECLLHISNDYEWMDDDLVNSPFHTKHFIFKISLNIDNERKMPIYSILNLQNGRLEREILDMYDKCILTTHDIPQIDPYLMKKLKFDVKNLKLSSIGFLDIEVQNQILQLTESYRKCLIPLYAYARKYDKFIELKCLNVQLYVDEKSTSSTASDIEREIYHQMRLCEKLKVEIPNDIIIGPFFIDIQQLKMSLIEKRMDVIKALKDNLLMTAKKKIEIIQRDYDAIIEHLTENPLTIEHLDDINKWIPSIPNEIQKLSEEMKMTLVDFRIIESFWIELSDEMFEAKWKVLQMPQIVNRQINETKKQHEIGTERFRKLHASDVTIFLEKLAEISHEIEFRLKNFQHGDEILNLWNDINSMRVRGELLNRRCVIFNQPEIDMELLNEHIECLHPHQKFWTMALNFLSSKEMWTEQIPLSMLDIQSIEAEIMRYDDIAMESRKYFEADEKMMENIEKISKEISEFEQVVDVLKDLNNPNLREIHFNRMSNLTKITTRDDSTKLNDIIFYGISRFSKTLKQVIIDAIEDATREREENALQEIEEVKRRQQEEEIRKHRELRRQARKDLFRINI